MQSTIRTIFQNTKHNQEHETNSKTQNIIKLDTKADMGHATGEVFIVNCNDVLSKPICSSWGRVAVGVDLSRQ
jgi:hypothetical protein